MKKIVKFYSFFGQNKNLMENNDCSNSFNKLYYKPYYEFIHFIIK